MPKVRTFRFPFYLCAHHTMSPIGHRQRKNTNDRAHVMNGRGSIETLTDPYSPLV